MSSTAKGLGEGSITPLRNGRFWVRSPKQPNGTRPSLGTYATRPEAEDVLEVARARLKKASAHSSALQFGRFLFAVLDEREADGFGGVRQDRLRAKKHLADCSISHMSVASTVIEPQHIADLGRELMKKYAADKRGKRLLSKSSVDHCISLVSAVMVVAVERGLRPNNPCAGIKVKRRKHEAKNIEKWTTLSPDEQRAFASCDAIPYAERVMMRFCWGSGIREGEFYSNDLTDLHVGLDEKDPHIYVRYGGSKGGVRTPPKSGKERKVRLFGDALVAAREWLRIRSSYLKLPEGVEDPGLIFPTLRGCRRCEGQPLGPGKRNPLTGKWESRMQQYARLAGVPIRPYLHWHCLRHTCASSLIQGHWGRRWTLEEICKHLGHSSIVVTQMYAHLADETMTEAAKATPGLLGEQPGYGVVTSITGGCVVDAAISNELNAYDTNSTGSTDLETRGRRFLSTSEEYPGVALDIPPENGSLITTIAATLRDLIASGRTEEALALTATLAGGSGPAKMPKNAARSSGLGPTRTGL